MVPALIILALWAALLAPGVLRWLREHRVTGSIAAFHRQLRQLERTRPRLLAAAQGLDGALTMEREPIRRQWERPALVLLRTGANDKEHTMRYDGRETGPEPLARRAGPRGRHAFGEALDREPYDPRDAYDEPWPDAEDEYEPQAATRVHRTVKAPVGRTPRAHVLDQVRRRAGGRREVRLTPTSARARRTRILAVLTAEIAGTFLLGLVPGLAVLWVLTVLGVVALGLYLGLMYYASSTGLYGASDERRPVARAVMPAVEVGARDEEEWEPEYAAAR